MALLSLQEVSVQFDTEDGPVKAVDSLSLDVQAGEVLGLVGESGSGKTVTAHTILGLWRDARRTQVSGKIFFQGENLGAASEERLRELRGKAISLIFQDPMTSLNPFVSIGTQLAEVLETHQGMSRKEALARAATFLQRVGIANAQNRLHQYPHEFSGGMRQRVMIAMALLNSPRLLIADEPTTALDVTVQSQVLSILEDLKRETGMSMILVTHDLGVVAKMADTIAVMYAGKIVERASRDQLLRNPRHPYTQALLQSVPDLRLERNTPLPSIPGSPPHMAHVPSGCAFHPRCAQATEKCVREVPRFCEVGQAHQVACWEVKA